MFDPDFAEQRILELHANQISMLYRSSYLLSSVRFLKWLFGQKSCLFSDYFLERAAGMDAEALDYLFKQVLRPPFHLSRAPIKFEQLTADDFLKWIVQLPKVEGGSPGKSALSSHRSALNNLFLGF